MDGSLVEEEAALSDFEEDDFDAAPVMVPAPAASTKDNTSGAVESLKNALAELESEKQARKLAEAAKADADSAAVRLKSYIHEVIRQRDEALRAKDERSRQLEEALQSKEDVVRQRDEILRQKEEISRARDAGRAEIAEVARILVTQAEKVMSMTSGIKSFSGGLPRVSKASGLAAIALGFGKRVEEVVEEVLRQREEAMKRRDEFHMQMEQRNFSTAIEVSQLEASITELKEESGKKSSELERWQKLAAGKDARIAEIEHTMLEQLGKTKQEAEDLKQRVEEVEGRLQLANSEVAQSGEFASKAKIHLLEILRLMRFANSSAPFQSDSVVVQNEDEPLHEDFSSEGHEIVDIASKVVLVWKEYQQNVESERKDWESTVKKLVEEKSDILLKLSFPDLHKISSKDSDLGLMNGTEDAKNGVLPGGREFLDSTSDDKLEGQKSSPNQNNVDVLAEDNTERYKIVGEVRQQTSLKLLQAELAACEKRNDQTVFKMALLEEEVKKLQQELERITSTSRMEIDRLQQLLAAQAKDLVERKAHISDLEKNVESCTGELLAAEEDVTRWKEAATAEAAAGAAILEEVEKRNEEIKALNERLAEFRDLVEEAHNKVSSKEEMALAAIAARNAAERSLQIADERAADLRYRIEEMSKQLEDFEQRGDYRGGGLLDMCWPWLRGRGRPVLSTAGQEVRGSAEMAQLLEPLV